MYAMQQSSSTLFLTNAYLAYKHSQCVFWVENIINHVAS